MSSFLLRLLKSKGRKTYNQLCSKRTLSKCTFIFNFSRYINNIVEQKRLEIKRTFLKKERD